ncbi:MAG TPA: hypothetical protein VK468_06465, partial [Pyrinomonadaceae bacterium]|nr:hypothetical protein [Pyrinomonadaceae bacterium]
LCRGKTGIGSDGGNGDLLFSQAAVVVRCARLARTVGKNFCQPSFRITCRFGNYAPDREMTSIGSTYRPASRDELGRFINISWVG